MEVNAVNAERAVEEGMQSSVLTCGGRLGRLKSTMEEEKDAAF